jgi:hypothetical protein
MLSSPILPSSYNPSSSLDSISEVRINSDNIVSLLLCSLKLQDDDASLTGPD